MTRALCLLAVCLCLLSAAQLSAQSPPPPGSLQPASKPPPDTLTVSRSLAPDTVRLTDGTSLTGEVLSHDPQSYVVIHLDDGRDVVLAAGLVAKVELGTPPGALTPGSPGGTVAAAPLQPGQVRVEETSKIDTARGIYTHELKSAGEVQRTLLDARAGAVRRETLDAQGNSTAIQADMSGASYSSDSDCADPDSPICREQRALSASGAGIEASYHRTSVEGVKEPPRGYTNVNLAAGGTLVVGDTTSFGGQIAGSYLIAFGGQLPGTEGGTWHGIGLEPGLQLMYFGSDGGGYGLMNFGASASYTGLKFGEMDTSTLKQSGVGWTLGLRLGAAIALQDDSEPSFSWGPQFRLSFPDYNAGTATVSDTNVTLFILPTGDITVISAQLGFGFGG